jgi:hypothetical protein
MSYREGTAYPDLHSVLREHNLSSKSRPRIKTDLRNVPFRSKIEGAGTYSRQESVNEEIHEAVFENPRPQGQSRSKHPAGAHRIQYGQIRRQYRLPYAERKCCLRAQLRQGSGHGKETGQIPDGTRGTGGRSRRDPRGEQARVGNLSLRGLMGRSGRHSARRESIA